jgi:starch synthase
VLTALLCPLLTLQAHYRDHGKMQFARSLLVLHNMAHQGRGPAEDLRLLEVPDKYTELFK